MVAVGAAVCALLAICLGGAFFLNGSPRIPAGEAVIKVEPVENPVYLVSPEDFGEAYRGWWLAFELSNESEIPFTPEKAVFEFYDDDRFDSRWTMGKDEICDRMGSRTLTNSDESVILPLGASEKGLKRAVCTVSGVDANGHEIKVESELELIKMEKWEADASPETGDGLKSE